MIIPLTHALLGGLSISVLLLLFSIYRNINARAALVESRGLSERLDKDKQALEIALLEAQEQLAGAGAQLGHAQGEIKGLQQRLDELKIKAQEGELSQQKLVRITAQLEMAQSEVGTGKEQLAQLSEQEKSLLGELQQLKASNASLKTDHDNMERRAKEQRQWVADQTQAFEDRIRVLTNSLLKKQTEETQQQSRKNLDELLTPFKTSLGDFKTQVEGFAREQLKEREGLAAQIKTLADVHGNLASQTDALTKALTQQNKQAGDWGEIQLTRYLETAGFEEGTHYKKQVTVEGAHDAGQQRPDVVLYLPENRQIIIDSKVSIKAWTGVNQTEDEPERKALLKQHVESLRRHIGDLHRKDYSASPDLSSVDFVVMFVPIEAAYLAAANEDAHLFQDAFRKGVIVASPTLLLAILKLVSTLWNMHKQEENAAQVLDMAGKIHNKLASFASSFEDIGSRLDSAQKAYESGFKQLTQGRGNAMSQLQKMEKLGIKVKKPLPDSVRKALDSSDSAIADE